MKISNIAIFGDSWAVTSFKKLPNMQEELDDTTFNSLFADSQYKVSNYAKQGGTNLDTLERIKLHGHNYDFLIVFQTDPIRQNFDKSYNLKKDLLLPPAKNFDDLCETLLKEFYLELAKTKTKILLIGGSSKLCFKHVPETLITLPMSWTELMVPDFKDHCFYWIENTLKLYDYARKKLNWSVSLSDFLPYEEQIKTKNYIWQTTDSFSWCHAAKPAYEKMFIKINEVLNDYSQTSS